MFPFNQREWPVEQDPSFGNYITSTFVVDRYEFALRLVGFPLGLEKWESIFKSGKRQGILNRLEKSGKITQNAGKFRNLRKMLFVIFSDI